jgi:hypothetical protein
MNAKQRKGGRREFLNMCHSTFPIPYIVRRLAGGGWFACLQRGKPPTLKLVVLNPKTADVPLKPADADRYLNSQIGKESL